MAAGDRHLLLVNPSAGGGRARELLPAVERALRRARARVPPRVHRGARARLRARREAAAQAGEIPVVMSGDGLIGQVGGALAGTGGADGADPGRARQRPRPRARHPDRGRRGGRGARRPARRARSTSARSTAGASSAIASCGFDSDANRIANEAKCVKGHARLRLRRAARAGRLAPAAFTLTLDGDGASSAATGVAAANSRAYGGGHVRRPGRRARRRPARRRHAGRGRQAALPHGNLPKVFEGTHVEQPEVGVARAAEVRIEADRPFAVYADGDHLADLPATVRVLPRALRRDRAGGPDVSAAFRAKLALARATGALSRRSGRGGGTTLPGRLLLRMAPDAVARLGAGLSGGSTIVSATNGKTTTAGMIAAALRAAGREPVHNRAGSNMTWGVATALLEQRGSEGLFEVDEAWLPRMVAELDPRLVVLGNLFRDQLDRYGELERLADDWARDGRRAGRAHRLRAQRRRPAGRRPRPRPRPAPARRGHLLRDRGPRAGAARAPARPRRQALPPLRLAVRLRARLRRPPRPLLLPQLRRGPPASRTSPRPRSSCTGCEGSRSRVAHARRRGRARAAPPRPLQRLQRARGARGGAAARRRPRARGRAAWPAVEAAFGRVETIEVDGVAGLDPADQEPGRRERGPAHAAPRGDAVPTAPGRASTSGSRSTTGSPTAATSPGSGTPTSSCSPATCGGSSAPGRARRRWRCGSSTPGWRPRRSRSSPRSSARSTARSPMPPAGSSRSPPTPRCSSCARCSPRAASRRSSGGERPRPQHEAIWHDVECGAYAADLALWGELAARGRRARARARLRHRARVALRLAPRRARGHGARPLAAADRRAAPARRRAEARRRRRVARRARVRARRRFAAVIAPMQLVHLLGGAAGRASDARARRGPSRRRGRRSPPRCSPSTRRRRPTTATARCRTCARRRLGLLEPAARGPRRRRRARGPAAAPARVSRRRARRDESTRSRLDELDPRSSSRPRRRRRARAARAGRDPAHRRPRRLDRPACWRRG